MKRRLNLEEHVDMAAMLETAEDAVYSLLKYQDILTKKEHRRICMTTVYCIGDLRTRLEDEMKQDYPNKPNPYSRGE